MSAVEVRHRELRGTPAGWPEDVSPVLRRIYAARGILSPDAVDHRLARLLPPSALGGVARAVELLAAAIREDWRIVVAGDYDVDGATGTAVAVRGLRLLGARRVGYAIPNRFIHGYGLTPELVATLDPAPQLIVTVDNGVASVAGVAAAQARGIRVIVTDHHLPGEQLPAADALVNPNLPGDGFPSKALAGVGVVFYLLLALRAGLYPDEPAGDGHAGATHRGPRPDLASLLDLVALGTVADLVPLDFNNRVLVSAGLHRMRGGHACAGIRALAEASGRALATLGASDLGFALGPRLNAAGRLEDMRIGVECLLADDPAAAAQLAARLDAINRERRGVQDDMLAAAERMLEGQMSDSQMPDGTGPTAAIGVVLHDATWHPGVVGLVASRMKDRLHRPVIAFAPANPDTPDELRGSARSIAGFHVRDALAMIDAREPGLIVRFGGHAMAAGLTLRRADLPRFAAAFDAVARAALGREALEAVLWTDGELPPGAIGLPLARQLRDAGPWGQAFPVPVFDNVFDCMDWKRMGLAHWRLRLRDPRDGGMLDAVMFQVGADAVPPPRLRAVYELTVNAWRGREEVRLLLRDVAAA